MNASASAATSERRIQVIMRPFNAPESKPVPGFGAWESPVTPDLLTGGTLGFSELQVDGEAVFWLERRATEGGRSALVRWTPGATARDVLGATADVGTRVHEYGGGGYTAADGHIVYSERSDGSVHLIDASGVERTIVAVPGCRYTGFTIDARRGRVYAVREDHRDRPPTNPANAIVALALEPRDPAANDGEVLYGASDFVLAPQLAPAGDRVAFIAWNAPAMPWDETEVIVLALDAAGAVGQPRVVAGGPGDAIVGLGWSPDGALVFASDRTNWWNLYAWRDGTTSALAPIAAEIGEPPWVFGRRAFVALGAGDALCVVTRDGATQAAIIGDGALHDLPFGSVDTTPLPYGEGAVFIAAPPDAPASIRRVDRLTSNAGETLRVASAHALEAGDVPRAQMLTIPTSDGEATNVTFYAPRNARVTPPAGAAPPLIVMSHGGPTATFTATYNLAIAWWTTRGFAVAHVNYRGSTGFGRTYRQCLAGAWGVLDVIDCISSARWLAARGACDPTRIAIRGGSASGMTALLAVATSDAFGAATSLYGVMDLTALAAATHKFEARYTDGLVGPLPAAAAVYRERSPIAHTATIDVPILLLQGLEDRVVPPDQATSMRDALTARGVRVAYEAFAGEGHGFRRAETVRRVLDLELDFYRDVFGLS
jgi:dipeptidyl aminopeptidase/acylaminoacyl peptidase